MNLRLALYDGFLDQSRAGFLVATATDRDYLMYCMCTYIHS